MLVEPFALDGRTDNQTANPMATLLYHALADWEVVPDSAQRM